MISQMADMIEFVGLFFQMLTLLVAILLFKTKDILSFQLRTLAAFVARAQRDVEF